MQEFTNRSTKIIRRLKKSGNLIPKLSIAIINKSKLMFAYTPVLAGKAPVYCLLTKLSTMVQEHTQNQF